MGKKRPYLRYTMLLLLAYFFFGLLLTSCLFESYLSELTLVASPSSMAGTVSGSGRYQEGDSVYISAQSNYGYTFINWNDGDTNPRRTITMPSTDITYTANFSENATISLSRNSYSYGSVSGAGTYVVGRTITITASPASGYRFVRWNDNDTHTTRTVTVPAEGATYTAYFERIPTAYISVGRNNNSYGSVSGSGTYYVGSNVTFTATPASGYRFVRWNDNDTHATRTVLVPSGGATYTAYFERNRLLTIFTETFETSYWLSNSTSFAGAWDNSEYSTQRWNRTSNFSYSGSYGAGAMGTYTSYSNSTYSRLKRSLYLSQFSEADLSFYLYGNTESNFDYFRVRVIKNGINYIIYSRSGSFQNWNHVELSLDSYVGSTVTLVFEFTSDGSVVPSGYSGVWIDNIEVTGQ